MPKGSKRPVQEEVLPIRFTTFNIPPLVNTKNAASSYLKSDSQTIWSRNAIPKPRRDYEDDEGAASAVPPLLESKRGSSTIVIHPGSRFLRIGRASDIYPVTVPHVIARKSKNPSQPVRNHRIFRYNSAESDSPHPSLTVGEDEYAVTVNPQDPMDEKVASLRGALRGRMRFYKLRALPQGPQQATSYNESVKVKKIPDHNDPYRIEWLDMEKEADVIIGSKVSQIADPQESGYSVRWPFCGGRFNSEDYTSQQEVLSDIETIWTTVLETEFQITPRLFKQHSAILIVPDIHDKIYVRDLVHLLLVQMGFKRVCIQQEAVCAAFGAGLSTACVVDIGAVKTSVTCVEDGLVLPETRMALDFGGDDITEFLCVLLEQIKFPYKDADLSRSYDFNAFEDLKSRICSLAEMDVDLHVNDICVRSPGKPAEKYTFKTYDEPIIAPMCIFESSAIDFTAKHAGIKPLWRFSSQVEDLDLANEGVTNAMTISTFHLIPPMLAEEEARANARAYLTQPPEGLESTFIVDPPPLDDSAITPQEENAQPKVPGDDIASTNTENGAPDKIADGEPAAGNMVSIQGPPGSMDIDVASTLPNPLDDAATNVTALDQASAAATAIAISQLPGPHGVINTVEDRVRFEASRTPLDVAVFNSIRVSEFPVNVPLNAGAQLGVIAGTEKIKKFLQVVLVVGGTALTPGIIQALESRLQAIAFPFIHGMEKVQVIPAPKEIDPRLLTWKGGSVLAKLDAVGDMWIQESDWDALGMRGLKERTFFL